MSLPSCVDPSSTTMYNEEGLVLNHAVVSSLSVVFFVVCCSHAHLVMEAGITQCHYHRGAVGGLKASTREVKASALCRKGRTGSRPSPFKTPMCYTPICCSPQKPIRYPDRAYGTQSPQAKCDRTEPMSRTYGTDPHEEKLTEPNLWNRTRPRKNSLNRTRLRGRTATQRSKKGSEKVLGRVLGKGSQKGSEKGACYEFCSKKGF